MKFKYVLQYFSWIFIVVVLLSSCSSSEERLSPEEHRQTIDEWHAQRIASLEERDSWLSLVGLYELEQGPHSVGSDSSNDIVFPPSAAPHIGTINRQDSVFTFKADANAEVTTNNGEKVTERVLKTDADDSLTVLEQGSFLWYIIDRGGDYYLRLKDTNHPNFSSFNGIEHFRVSQNWRIKATFNRFAEPETITIPDVLNKEVQDSLYGTLNFTIDGKEFSIAPLGNPDKDEEFFIIMGDKTNGESTYSGGRYIYADTPDEDGITYIDFNKAYNPPCVFTLYATCPLPPAQNRLSIKIPAGEKMYHNAVEYH